MAADGDAAGMTLPESVDVLVVGFGVAGASAAIAAHDAGATVAVVEKTPAGGGNCLYSGGFLFDVEEPVAVEHLDALCFGKTDRAVLRAFADGLHGIPGWLDSLGGRADPVDPTAFGGMLPSWPGFPGAGHVSYRQFVAPEGSRPGPALWHTLARAVADRGIPVAGSSPVVELLVEDGAVCGAVIETGTGGAVTAGDYGRALTAGGSRARVRAAAVVLASGGFEYDAELCDTYLPLPVVPVGHSGNTGDTVRLAAAAGASLWHMSAFFGWFSFRHPDFAAAFTLDVHAPSFLYVDGDGRRFADETGWEVHDKVRSATTYLPRRPNRPRLPGWIVFDEAARLAGPLHGIVGTPNDYGWSVDNAAELAAGWIAAGDTPAELAAATRLDADVLSDTLTRYAASVAAGRDDEFGRAPATLAALEPPLYAIQMWAGLATASGGPRRDVGARVTGAGGAPIPGLFAAGGAGSIWGHLTEHGGGLSDAIVFGRIAGAGGGAAARVAAS
jgi:succinate dehydrogenase/fumarate reductase flavoprotein subunit